MSRSEFRPVASDEPGSAKGAEKAEIRMASVPAAALVHAGKTAEFDPRNSFFPQELLATDLPPSPKARPAPWIVRNSGRVLLVTVLATGAGLGYMYFHAPRMPALSPAGGVTSAPQGAKPMATAAGSITSAPVSSPQQLTIPTSAPVAAPTAPAPEARKTAAIATTGRAPGASGGEPWTSGRAAAGSLPAVTHTRSGAASGNDASQAADATRRAAMSASAAAEAARGETRTSVQPEQRQAACADALAALGLCVPAVKN